MICSPLSTFCSRLVRSSVTTRFFSCVSHQSRFLFSFLLFFFLFFPVENSYMFLGRFEWSSPVGRTVEWFALFLASATAVSRFASSILLLASIPRHRHHYYYFLRFHPSPPTPISFAGADVLPLSSREKFFYNFRIVLSRPSLFFHLCAGRFPRVGLFFHHQACFSSSSPIPPFSLSLFLSSRFLFSLSHFHLVFLALNPLLAPFSRFIPSFSSPPSLRQALSFSFFGGFCQERSFN